MAAKVITMNHGIVHMLSQDDLNGAKRIISVYEGNEQESGAQEEIKMGGD